MSRRRRHEGHRGAAHGSVAALLVTLSALLGAASGAEAAFRIGPPVEVTDDYPAGDLTAVPFGDQVLLLWSDGISTTTDVVLAASVSLDGTASGGVGFVASSSNEIQELDAAALGADRLVVVWESGDFFDDGDDGSELGLVARRLTREGALLGSELVVNEHTTGSQARPAVAADGAGGFVVVWTDFGGGGQDIVGRRFTSAGTPIGGDFPVPATPSGQRIDPAVAMRSDGAFVVTWTDSADTDGDEDGVFARRFDASGVAVGGDLQVNVVTADDQDRSAVAMTEGGSFLVLWESRGVDGDDDGIAGRLFDSLGNPTTDELLVNTYTTGFQSFPDVTTDAGGGFIALWASEGAGLRGDRSRGQRIGADGLPSGREFLVEGVSNGGPVIAAGAGSELLAAWRARGDVDGLRAQRLTTRTLAISTAQDLDRGSCSLDDCSLREANDALTGDGAVALRAARYALPLGAVRVTDELRVLGAGTHATVLAGGGDDRLFRVDGGALRLSGLTLEGGVALNGGAVVNEGGSLALERVLARDNRALTIGGAIDTRAGGETRVSESTFEGNVATTSGGAMSSAGRLEVAASTFTGNLAPGATAATGGGAIYVEAGELALTDSTLSGDRAVNTGGELLVALGSAALTHVTLDADAASGGGTLHAFAGAELSLANTLVVGGCGGAGAVLSAGGNLESPADSCALDGEGDQVSVTGAALALDELAQNGGRTRTRALGADSVALDAALVASCTPRDQRGVPRPQDGDDDGEAACDVGAFERAAPIFDDGFESGDLTAWSTSG